MSEETWKDILGYEGCYQISNLGRVKSLNYRGHKNVHGVLNTRYYKKHEYAYVELKVNKKAVKKKIHRLLAEHFIPNLENKKQVNHIDGNKRNFDIKNLEWASPKENINHADRTKLRDINGMKNKQSKLANEQVIFIRKLHLEYQKMKKIGIDTGFTSVRIAKIFSVTPTVVCGISRGEMWRTVV